MIKLRIPFNYKGLLHEAGTVISAPPEMESKLVETGSAEHYVVEKKEELEPEPESEVTLEPKKSDE